MKRQRMPGMIGMEKYKKYALLLPLVYKNGQWRLVFEIRAEGLRRQPGEICFPGGKVENGEEPEMAALRETCEELLVPAESVEMIEPLDVFVSPFDLIVYPYLGELRNYQGTYSKAEVGHILEIPVTWFEEKTPEIYKNHVYTEPGEHFPYDRIPGGRSYPWNHGSYDVVFYEWPEDGQRYVIWGLTAAVLKGSVKLVREYLDIRENGA